MSHMREMGGAGISALPTAYAYCSMHSAGTPHGRTVSGWRVLELSVWRGRTSIQDYRVAVH
jgi:hypothetical protein